MAQTEERVETLTDEHFEKLTTFRVRAMSDRLRELLADDTCKDMTVSECMIELIDAEDLARTNRKISKLNSKAKFAVPGACIEEIIYLPERKLDKGYVNRLASGQYIDDHDHVVIISECGCGKSYIAQALGNAACRQKRTVRYIRHQDLCKELNIAKKCGTYYEIMDSFISADLLLLDDFFTVQVSEANVIDTFEIIEARVEKGSMIISSIVEPDQWHLCIKTDRLADSIIDRIVHRTHFLDISGPNMREYLAKQRMDKEK
jgi:DNA replication protein DnaC